MELHLILLGENTKNVLVSGLDINANQPTKENFFKEKIIFVVPFTLGTGERLISPGMHTNLVMPTGKLGLEKQQHGDS